MAFRIPTVLLVPLALVGCAHTEGQSVASAPSGAAASSSKAQPGAQQPGQLVDEGPAGASAPVASAGAGQLVPFHSSGGFTVLMPANPQQVDRSEETPGGKVQIHVAQASDPSAQYVSTYSEFPPGTLEKVKTPALLASFQSSTLAAMKGTLVRTRDIEVEGLPGRQFTASDPGGSEMTARLLVGRGRLYSLAGTYPQGQTPESVQRFLGSFARSSSGGPGVGGSGPASEGSTENGAVQGPEGSLADPRAVTPAPVKRSGRTTRGTEVPTGTADPSAPASTR